MTINDNRRQNSVGGNLNPDFFIGIGDGHRRGFTLAEAMLAVVVLGIAAAGLLLPFSSGARLRVEGMHRTLGAKLASHLMEQIVHTSFDQIMDDYDGYSEAEGQVKNAAGVMSISLLGGTLIVAFSNLSSLPFSGPPTTILKSALTLHS